MAIKSVQVDDLTGKELEGEVEQTYLTFEGKTYKLDLAPESVDKLRKALEPFISNVDPVPTGAKPSKARSSSTGGLPADLVRAWAKENNVEVNERGRLSKEVVAAYKAAHGL